MVAAGRQSISSSSITLTKICSANPYRCLKRRVGRSLRGRHCKGNLVPYRKQVTLKAGNIPGWLNVIADKLSRQSQTIQTEWSLLPEVFQAICSWWHQPQVDLFCHQVQQQLPQFVSAVPDPLAWAVDALSLPWEDLEQYAIPPVAILGKW